MAEDTTPLTPEQQAAADKAADDKTVADSPSQAELDLANAQADKADKDAKAVEADSSKSEAEKEAARDEADEKAKNAAEVGKKKGDADKIKAERASKDAKDANALEKEGCNVDNATAKQSGAQQKMMDANPEFKACVEKSDEAAKKVKCKKAAINKVDPPVPPSAEAIKAAEEKAELSAAWADDSEASPSEKAEAAADKAALDKLLEDKAVADKAVADQKQEEEKLGCPANSDGSDDPDLKAEDNLNKAKKATTDAKDSKQQSEDNLDKAEDDIVNLNDELEDLRAQEQELVDKNKELSSDPNATAEIEANRKKIAELTAKIELAKMKLTDAEKVKKEETAKLDSGSDDAAIAQAEKDEEAAQKKRDTAQKNLETLEKESEAAKEDCEAKKEELAEKYPETFGKDAEAFDKAKEEKEDCIEEKAAANSEPFSLLDLGIPSIATLAIGAGVVAGLIDLFGGSDSFTNSSGGAIGSPPPPGEEGVYLHWDAPATKAAEGVLENLIADHLQPIYKHSFIGEFPDKISGLDWMVKTMDRPKIDVEYVEQIRNNVKRQYPIKYNFGDLSMTFHDDVKHKTILTLHNYFTSDVWSHDDISGYGKFKMRDSVLIPEIKIYDLTVETGQHLRYTYQNVSLVSLDYDAPDEAEDGGIYTIQAVFKIEGYKVEESKSPPTLNSGNAPIWV